MEKLSHIAKKIAERYSQFDSWAGEHCPKTYFVVAIAIMAVVCFSLISMVSNGDDARLGDGDSPPAFVGGHGV
ncbi:hypothetical protein KMC50_gp01 [Ralstonia phage Claudette]|uniref:Transmembrane protein n=2 Tax=Gervaisevirus claudettte TaxID=2846041 RepID=A0A7G5B838_9CAUD|nr:hypothetical protein KMC50_gp01 [Ralstonia phage Claudette]QMV32461.1 hypothetical protein 20A_00011 [Ralstonia phage Alix]QMV32708.1 hypothetical protein 20Ca_00001 [Ralstonia phage Claudette]